jgi:hypothetical protein
MASNMRGSIEVVLSRVREMVKVRRRQRIISILVSGRGALNQVKARYSIRMEIVMWDSGLMMCSTERGCM